ncbi:baculoviral IAP repeat-containing protein 7-like [Mercenaria mercenaria]|uniref:baculoviral IAP repeat-containing protein 7-like n=1 Tax=Mercenaria mercenaria TaxID=6596 RepID=UPI00234EB3D9|nr:baculoviral IAP repeat-containing protein 7-like [Mercenaria mercenaria]
MKCLVVTVGCVAAIETFEASVQNFRKHSHTKDDVNISLNNDGKLSKLPFLREFASTPIQRCWTLPFSLGEYLNKAENGNKVEFMNYEWGRYESFKNFPMESPVTPMRLASNGFYYTGTKDTVECFSCKLKYSGWKEGDEPDDLHKRLSPDCNFMKGVDSTNVPIHPTSESISNGSEYPMEGAIGGANYTTENYRESYNAVVHAQRQSRQSQASNDSGSLQRINHKYPDFEKSQNRTDSFKKWPCQDVIDPAVLVFAGFFYAGFSDCVRCFSCGGGLRNWEYGDGPWEEHARWFPGCKFLRQQKGLEFIRQYQETRTDSEDELPTEAIVSGDEALRTLRGNRSFHETGNNTIGAKICENETEVERTIAYGVKDKLNEMGISYSFDHVRKAIHRLKLNGDQILIESVIIHLIDNPEEVERDNLGEKNISEEGSIFIDNIRINNETENKVKHNAKSSRTIASDLTPADSDTLQEENTKLKKQLLCKICMDSDSNVVFIPCGHMVSCEKCAPHIRKCAVCRVPIKGRVKAFMS